MDYAAEQAVAGKAAAYAGLGGQQQLNAPSPSRALDAVGEAVFRLRSANAQVRAIIDRFSPSPPTDVASVSGAIGRSIRQPYTVAVQDLCAEIGTLQSSLDTLEKFV